jgi:hypothetical protein
VTLQSYLPRPLNEQESEIWMANMKQVTKILQLERERDALKARLAEYIEQAAQGVFATHDCPAMFACAFIVADNAGKDKAQSYCAQHMKWHGDCLMEQKP